MAAYPPLPASWLARIQTPLQRRPGVFTPNPVQPPGQRVNKREIR